MPILPVFPSLARRHSFALIAQAASVSGTGGGRDRHVSTAVTSFTAAQALLAATFLALSPLVGRRNGASAALGVAYEF